MTPSPLEQAAALLAPLAGGMTHPEPHRLDAVVAADRLRDAVAALAGARWGYLAAITGLDRGPEGPIEVLYHFCAGAHVATLRVSTPRAAATVPSICGIIPSAVLFERELSEMFGVAVEGLSDPRRLFLPDDWPEGTFPLRKETVLPAPPEA